MKREEAISILATSVRPREPKDQKRYDEAVQMAIEALKAQDNPDTATGDIIYRRDAINEVCKMLRDCFWADDEELDAVEITINNLSSAQPERKTGHWVGIDDEPCDVYECDVCGTTYDTCDSTWDLPNYCPKCGASMEEGDDG